MRSKKKLAVVAVTAVTLLLLVIPAVYGIQPDNSGILYSVYLEWLQEKPVGLAQVNPILPHSVENTTLVVIDYSSNSPRVLYKGPFMSPTVKIERIPIGTKLKTRHQGRKGKPDYGHRIQTCPVARDSLGEGLLGGKVRGVHPR